MATKHHPNSDAVVVCSSQRIDCLDGDPACRLEEILANYKATVAPHWYTGKYGSALYFAGGSDGWFMAKSFLTNCRERGIDLTGVRLVHGKIKLDDASVMDHCWIELPDNTVFDGVVQTFYKRADYLNLIVVEQINAYTVPQADRLRDTSKHWGPWTDEERKACEGSPRLKKVSHRLQSTAKTPNLFDFAPRELSQDAFLCWLLSWAHYSHLEIQPGLHRTAVALLRQLLSLAGIEVPGEICSLEVRKYKDIDILVLANADIALVIEDKVTSSTRKNPLTQYRETVQADFPERTQVATVYFTTDDPGPYERGHASNAGFAVFRRDHFLEVLTSEDGSTVGNAIFREYVERLQRIDDSLRRRRRRGW